MFETLKNAFKVKEIRKKIFITLLLLLVYRLGCYIPVPGVDGSMFGSYIEEGSNSFLTLMSAVTGGALSQGTLFALGIGPYINASIIMQLLAVGIPALERLSKQGEEGKKKIAAYTRILTLVLAIVQAIGVIINFANQSGAINTAPFWDQTWLAYIFMAIVYTAGAMLTMWLGERITEHGVGNGISMIIFVGIISTAGQQLIIEPIQDTIANGFSASTLVSIIIVCVLAVIIFGLIVTVDLAERRIPVQYAKQVKGRKMYGGQSTVIPIKISGSGVMPLIFAFAIISLPDLIMGLFAPNWSGYEWYSNNISGGQGPWAWAYIIVLCLLIFAFSFFYAQIQFNPEDISKSIQQNGGFIPGIRPGKPTSDYLSGILSYIVFLGAAGLAVVCIIPIIASGLFSVGKSLKGSPQYLCIHVQKG